jgi:hypothetical protein
MGYLNFLDLSGNLDVVKLWKKNQLHMVIIGGMLDAASWALLSKLMN